MKNIVAAILTGACAVFAALLGVQVLCGDTAGREALGQEPKALGWERGQSVPESAIVKPGFAEGPLKTDFVQPVAGLDEVLVGYTDKQGVCSVMGAQYFIPNYAREYRDKVDEWASGVGLKFRVDGNKLEWNSDTVFNEPKDWLRAFERGRVYYFYSWQFKELPEGYADATVELRPGWRVVGWPDRHRHQPRVRYEGLVVLTFRFDNWGACVAEREAAMQAKLSSRTFESHRLESGRKAKTLHQ